VFLKRDVKAIGSVSSYRDAVQQRPCILAPRMTFIALMQNSPASLAVWSSIPKLNIPMPGIRKIARSAPRIGGV
jgi:hypothetical protein